MLLALCYMTCSIHMPGFE
uniref:Uncharacterized protein n=1 Tax=Anguilla anguilla TaxID=7936 RepID=A0A0E9U6M2_ANGAN